MCVIEHNLIGGQQCFEVSVERRHRAQHLFGAHKHVSGFVFDRFVAAYAAPRVRRFAFAERMHAPAGAPALGVERAVKGAAQIRHCTVTQRAVALETCGFTNHTQ